MNFIKKKLSTVILIFIFFMGLSLLLYPIISDYWNSLHQSKAIASYVKSVENLKEDEHESLWKDAVKYNEELYDEKRFVSKYANEEDRYKELLNISDNGIMCYIEIPSINLSLPVYHGVDESILQVAVGHLFGTSLPVGGKNTHTVLSGHRGLPSASLFTNLDQLSIGDTFMLHTLNETLTYEVDQILVVKPDEMQALQIEEGKDLCTLVTCTPYGVNSHRMLVRGHRIPNVSTEISNISADAINIQYIVVACLIVFILLIIIIKMIIFMKKSKNGR